jgi:hypothetical protein
MKKTRRQERTGDRQRLQIYLDAALHQAVIRIARARNVSRSMAARHLMQLALNSLNISSHDH